MGLCGAELLEAAPELSGAALDGSDACGGAWLEAAAGIAWLTLNSGSCRGSPVFCDGFSTQTATGYVSKW